MVKCAEGLFVRQGRLIGSSLRLLKSPSGSILLLSLLLVPLFSCSGGPDAIAFCPLSQTLLTYEGLRATVIYGYNAAQMDIDAAEMIADHISSIGGEAIVLNASSVDATILEGGNLILVGGPEANHYSAEANELVEAKLVIRDGKWFVKLYPWSGFMWGKRYGLVEGLANPWNENYTLIYVAGVDRYGTMASAKALLEMSDEIGVYAALIWYDRGFAIIIRKETILIPPTLPPELVFLNSTKPGGVPLDATRVWVILENVTGWYRLRNATQDQLVFNQSYNSFFLERNVNQSRAMGFGENVSMFLGRYFNSTVLELQVELPWTKAFLNHTPAFSNFSLYTMPALIEKGQVAPIPWSQGRAFLMIEEILADGTFQVFLLLLKDGGLVPWDLVTIDLDTTRRENLSISLGPDIQPTNVTFLVTENFTSTGWARMMLRVDFGFQPAGLLNLTDTAVVGDDLNFSEIGLFVQGSGANLWVAKVGRMLVPYCEGLVKMQCGVAIVDPSVWEICQRSKRYLPFDEDDWLVAATAIPGA